MKYSIPSTEPGKVADLTSKMIITKYGNTARKYEAFPELLTPLMRIPVTHIQASTKQTQSCQFGLPIPLSIDVASFKISFLKKKLIYKKNLIYYFL